MGDLLRSLSRNVRAYQHDLASGLLSWWSTREFSKGKLSRELPGFLPVYDGTANESGVYYVHVLGSGTLSRWSKVLCITNSRSGIPLHLSWLMNKFVLGFGVLYWTYSVSKELKPTGGTGREDPERDIDAIQLPNHAWSDQLSPLPNDLHDYTAKFNMPQHISAGVPRIAAWSVWVEYCSGSAV